MSQVTDEHTDKCTEVLIVPAFVRTSATDVRERTETSSLQEAIKLPRIS